MSLLSHDTIECSTVYFATLESLDFRPDEADKVIRDSVGAAVALDEFVVRQTVRTWDSFLGYIVECLLTQSPKIGELYGLACEHILVSLVSTCILNWGDHLHCGLPPANSTIVRRRGGVVAPGYSDALFVRLTLRLSRQLLQGRC